MTFDLQGSRQLTERGRVQRELLSAIKETNISFKNQLLGEFMITGGDEFQGALHQPTLSYGLFIMFQRKIQAPFYCGIGMGEITILGRSIVEMDGPAFHRSREALNFAKKENLPLVFLSAEANSDLLLNLLTRLTLAIRTRRTQRQKQVVEYLQKGENRTLKETSIHFEVSEQAISKVVKAANMRLIQASESYLQTLLDSENLVLPSAELIPSKTRRALQPLLVDNKRSTPRG